MKYSIFTQYNDDEEEKKPSQIAATQQKQEYTIFTKYNDMPVAPEVKPKTTPPPAPKKNIFEQGIDFVTGLLGVKKKETPAKLDVSPNNYNQKLDDFLKFPSLFPNPDLDAKESGSSAMVKPEIQAAHQKAVAPYAEVATKFLTKPIDTTIDTMRDVLSYSPQLMDVLAGAQTTVEDILNSHPTTKGIFKGVTLSFLGSSQQVQDIFNSRLINPVTQQGKTMETVGEVVGGLAAFMSGGSVLKAFGFGKAALPVLFATIGQLSAGPETTEKQRLLKLPVDVIAGYLFSKVPGLKGKGAELLKIGAKGTLASAGFGSMQAYINSQIEGKSKEETKQIVLQTAIMMGLLHIGMSSLGLLSDQIGKSKVSEKPIDIGVPKVEVAPKPQVKAEVGITSFRGTPVKTVAETKAYYETTRSKGFEKAINEAAPPNGITVSDVKKSAGFWEGNIEPSFSVKVEGTIDDIYKYSAKLGKKANQDAAAIFVPGEGESIKWEMDGIESPDLALKMLKNEGVSGATVVDKKVIILDIDKSLKSTILKVGKELNATVNPTPGTVDFLEKGNYDKYIGTAESKSGDILLSEIQPKEKVKATVSEQGPPKTVQKPQETGTSTSPNAPKKPEVPKPDKVAVKEAKDEGERDFLAVPKEKQFTGNLKTGDLKTNKDLVDVNVNDVKVNRPELDPERYQKAVKMVKNYDTTKDPIHVILTKSGELRVGPDGNHRIIAAQNEGITKLPVKISYEEGAPIEKYIPKPVEKVSVPREQLPVGEGKLKASRLQARVNKVLDKTPEAIKEELGLATYNEMSRDANIAAATKFVTENPAEAMKVLTGEIPAPKGILRNSLYVAMENNAVGDVELAQKLASLSSTRYGQEINILSKLNPDNPVRAMRNIIEVREKAYEARTGKKSTEAIKKTTATIKEKIKIPDKYDWKSFIKSIEC